MSQASDRMRRKIMGYIVSQAIFSVCELGIPDALSTGPVCLEDLARRFAIDRNSLRRFLRVLVGEGIFTECSPDLFGLTEMGELLRNDVPGSLAHLAELMAGEAYEAWGSSAYSLKHGQPAFDTIYGKSYFDWLSENPQASERFARGQAGLVELRMQPLLGYDWNAIREVVDVGGGDGTLLARLLREYPQLSGIVFDLPHVVGDLEAAARYSEGRLRSAAGSFFDYIPPGADVYILSQILHDWNDGDAANILRRCRSAIPAHGRLLIVEQVLPNQATNHPMALLDLHMLVLLGGMERTEDGWKELLAVADFELRSITPGPKSYLIEAFPIG
ncbi:methyltransferase [Nocardia salmonicida]|uniref:methyltransferase n=1 Tax=Nocardia salmonicida TaxID=53431 RepID=UPI0037ACD384